MQSSSPQIRLVAMDVDGTLTDGMVTIHTGGEEQQTFSTKDGAGIKLLPGVGIMPVIISGRSSPATAQRAEELGIDEVVQGVEDKAEAFEKICEYFGVKLEEAAFIGDDLSDLPAMLLAGYSAAPSDAAPEVRAAATFTSDLPGGAGAVRQSIEDMLKRMGVWQDILESLGLPGTPA